MPDLETGAAPAATDTAAIADVQTAEPDHSWSAIEKTIDITYDKLNPPREGGRFVAKDKPDGGAEEPASDTPAENVSDQNPIEAKVEPVQPAIDAPISWSAEMKSKWSTLPPDAQSYIAQREGEAHKRISELGQQVKAVEPIRNVVEHFRDTFTRNGLDPADAIARMLNVESMLERDPVATIHEIARAYGVDLSGGQSAQGEQQSESGEVRALKTEIAQLKRAIGETASKVTARERSEQDREQAAIAEKITSFAKDKPHFEKVRRHMGALMSADEALSLDDAYEMAIHAVPEIRNTILAEKQKAEAEKAEKERAEKAKEAKRVGSLNVKTGSASPAKAGRWEDTVDAVARRLG